MRKFDPHQKILLIILITITMFLGFLVIAIMNVQAYEFWVMQAGEDAYVVCENGHIQTDHTLPIPRPTPTVSPYPGPPDQYQTSVYIKCTSEEPSILSIKQRNYFPIIGNSITTE